MGAASLRKGGGNYYYYYMDGATGALPMSVVVTLLACHPPHRWPPTRARHVVHASTTTNERSSALQFMQCNKRANFNKWQQRLLVQHHNCTLHTATAVAVHSHAS